MPDTSCTIYLQFTPSSTGLRTASLQIADDASNTPQTVALIGAGQADAEALYASAQSLDFGSQNINSGTSTGSVSLQNDGTSNITFSGIQISGVNASEFTFNANTCGTTLAPGSTCAITPQFAPTAVGLQTANLVITTDAPGSPLTIPLTGLGQANTEVISLSNVNIDFGAENLNAQNTSSITVTNQGTDPVQFSPPTIIGTNAGDFVIASNTCATAAPGGYGNSSCTINVAFTPSAAGERTATLNVIDNATGSPQTVSLFGTGQVISQLLSPSTTTLDFGLQASGVASSILSMPVINTGNDPVDISAIKITGTNAADFQNLAASQQSYNCTVARATLPVGYGCYVYVQFTPSTTAAESATLTVSSDSSSGPILVTLIGEGQAATRTLSASPSLFDFGTSAVGAAANGTTVNVTNTGTEPVTFYAPTFMGTNAADFALTYNGCTGSLNPGVNCSISLGFTPSITGAEKATLNLFSNATGSPLAISLVGEGATP